MRGRSRGATCFARAVACRLVPQQLVAPLDRRRQGSVPGHHSGGVPHKEPESVVEPGRDLTGSERARPGRRQLDREGDCRPGGDRSSGRQATARCRISSPPPAPRPKLSQSRGPEAVEGQGHHALLDRLVQGDVGRGARHADHEGVDLQQGHVAADGTRRLGPLVAPRRAVPVRAVIRGRVTPRSVPLVAPGTR
jgi:hypothetical protein